MVWRHPEVQLPFCRRLGNPHVNGAGGIQAETYAHKIFQEQNEAGTVTGKTLVTDLRTEGIHFLGFVVKAERKRKTPDPKTWTENLVGKPLPDMERLKEKIQKIAGEVRVIGEITERSVQAAQIQTKTRAPCLCGTLW